MDLAVLRPNELSCALPVLRDIVASNGTITPAERRFLELIAELHGTTVDVDALERVEPSDVARAITEPHQRKRLVQLALIAAMVEGDVTPGEDAEVAWKYKSLGLLPQDTLGRLFWEHSTRNRFGFPGKKELFDVAKVLRAAQRGAACTVDLSDHWDPSPVVELPVTDVRERFGIPPL
jgi:hypothetical protein